MGHYLHNLWEEYLKVHKTAYKNLGIYGRFLDMGAIYASLSGTAQVSMVIMHVCMHDVW